MHRGRVVGSIACALALDALTLGCAIPELDLASRNCPCAAGWTCDTRVNTCVEGALGAADASGPDAGSGRPGARPDGGSSAGTTGEAGADAAPSSHSDASAQDAGASEAGPPDAGSPCANIRGAVVLYDGFESDRIGFTQGAISASNFDRSYPFPHTGSSALRVQVTYPTIARYASQVLAQPITDGTFYLRTFLFLDRSVTPVSIDVLAFYSEQSGQGIHLLYTDEGMKLQLDASQATLSLGSVAETIGRWVEVEIAAKVGLEGEIAVCVDGREVASSATNTLLDGGSSRVDFGVVRIPNTQGKVVLYADEFLLEHAPAETQ